MAKKIAVEVYVVCDIDGEPLLSYEKSILYAFAHEMDAKEYANTIKKNVRKGVLKV